MATLTQANRGSSAQPPVVADLLAGVVLEVSDLAATRAFYEPIFRDGSGVWSEGRRNLTFQRGRQSIEFVQKTRPQTFSDGGNHQAYRVRRSRLDSILAELTRAGHQVDWWREDHPSERTPSAYLQDPSGNRVQLVPSDDGSLLLDHVAVEVFEFDYVEYVYLKALNGRVDYYHGWKIEDYDDARAWASGDDPAAPWTRRDNPGWTDFRDQGRANQNLRVARPNTHEFIGYGDTRLCLLSATRIVQEPPEEMIKGTPRAVFHTAQPIAEVAAALPASLPIPFEHQGRSAFIQDPDGNFLELRCDK
jgi:predicted enzyme related to lactoylglutathione lyase